MLGHEIAERGERIAVLVPAKIAIKAAQRMLCPAQQQKMRRTEQYIGGQLTPFHPIREFAQPGIGADRARQLL